MADPRMVVYGKNVQVENEHHEEVAATGSVQPPEPGKKPTLEEDAGEVETC